MTHFQRLLGCTISDTPKWWREDPSVHPDDYLIYEQFRCFLDIAWQAVGLPAPTPAQIEIADYLQYGPQDSVIMAFRGIGKSWITSAFVLWLLLRNPQQRIMVVSASRSRADNFTTFCMQLMFAMPLLNHLLPLPHQRQSKLEFDVAPAAPDHAASVTSRGISGQMTGGRADVIIADDVEVPKNSATQTQREKILQQVSEFNAILKPGGSIKYLGTPQSFQSIYNQLEGFSIRIWPAQYPSADKMTDTAWWQRLAPSVRNAIEKNLTDPGQPVDPLRFSEEELIKRQVKYGKSNYALQFMLDVSISDTNKFPLKLGDLIVMDVDIDQAPETVVWASSPELVHLDIETAGFPGDRYYRPMQVADKWQEYTGRVMAIDPAGTGEDEVGVAVGFMLKSQVFVKLATGLQGGYRDDNLIKIAKWCKEFKVNRVLIEKNFGDGMFGKLLQPFLIQYAGGVTVEEVWHSTQKEARIIDTLEPVMNRHKLVVDRKVLLDDLQMIAEDNNNELGDKARDYMLAHQMAFLTRDRGALSHDDRLEALSIMVNYFVDQMTEDEHVAHDMAKQQRIDDWLDELQSEYRRFPGQGSDGPVHSVSFTEEM